MSDTNEDFNSGYSDDETTTGTPALEVTNAPEPEPVIEYAQITKSDYESIQAKLAELDTLKAEQAGKFDKAFGALGGLKQSIESFRNQATGEVEISPEDFAELRANYPEVADDLDNGLKRVLGKIKGVGNNPNVDQLVQERLTPELEKLSSNFQSQLIEIRLESAHSDWKEVVTKKEFTDWMDKEGLQDSTDPKVVSSYISRFKDTSKPKERAEEKPSTRQQRFSAAVTPKGNGANPAPNKTDLDDFRSGYSDD